MINRTEVFSLIDHTPVETPLTRREEFQRDFAAALNSFVGENITQDLTLRIEHVLENVFLRYGIKTGGPNEDFHIVFQGDRADVKADEGLLQKVREL